MKVQFPGLGPLGNKKLKYLKFIYDQTWGYRRDAYYDYPYLILGDLLLDEVGSRLDLIEWIINPRFTHYSGNMTFMEKKFNGTICIDLDPAIHLCEASKSFLREMFSDSEIKDKFIITPKNLIHIMQEWVECIKKGYPEIWIKNDRGTFWVEGVR